MSNNIGILIDTKILSKISKNNIFNKIIEGKYILLQNQNLEFIFNSDDVEVTYIISSHGIYKQSFNSEEYDKIVNSINADFTINKPKQEGCALQIEERAISLLLKISGLTDMIIVNINSQGATYLYKEGDTLFSIESDHIFTKLNYKPSVYKNEFTTNIDIDIVEFKSIVSAHYAIQEYKSITGDNPQIQFLIDTKIKILSTNYVVGLIHYLATGQVNNVQQLQAKKNIDIGKIFNIFDKPDKISILSYNPAERDQNGRMRTNFIRIAQMNSWCDIRLYESNINLFDESIIDSQINYENTLRISCTEFIDLINSIKNIMDLKKINNIIFNFDKISGDKIKVGIECQSLEAVIKFDKEVLNTSVDKFMFKTQGYTAHMISNIINKQKSQGLLNINVSKTGEQGKITTEDKCPANLIFV